MLSAFLGVALTDNPLKLLAAAAIAVLGPAFFSCLSMSIAGLAQSPGPADGHRPDKSLQNCLFSSKMVLGGFVQCKSSYAS